VFTHTHSVPNKNTSLKNPKKFATFAALFFCISIWFSSFAFAQNVVTSASNTGAGTLREIITNAPAGSTITFDLVAMGTNVITLSSRMPIPKNLKIDGGSGVIISGGNTNGMFRVENVVVEIKNLTLENGNDNFSGLGANGFAVIMYGSNGTTSFTAINCTFKNNNSYYGGGAMQMSGDAGSGSHIFFTAINCTFENNNSDASSGGAVICNAWYGVGSVSFTAINCTFKNNNAGSGGAVSVSSSASFTAINCTFKNNNAGSGGAVYVWSKAYLYHCTFDGNSASVGDGICIHSSFATLYSYNSIFTGSDNQIVAVNGGTNNASPSNNLIQGVNGLTRAEVFAGDDLVCGGIVEYAKVLKKGFDITHPDAANIITLLKRDQAGNKRRGFTATYGAVEAIGCPPKPPLPFKGNIIVRGGATLKIGK